MRASRRLVSRIVTSTSKQTRTLRHEERMLLRRWVRMPTAPQRVVTRSRIVLLLAEGRSTREVARVVGVSRPTVSLWHRRFIEGGCAALERDRPGRGRKKATQAMCRAEVDFGTP
jgi:DNA-binding NarL/FixJ family response regulator